MLTKHYYFTNSDYSQFKCTLVTEIKNYMDYFTFHNNIIVLVIQCQHVQKHLLKLELYKTNTDLGCVENICLMFNVFLSIRLLMIK